MITVVALTVLVFAVVIGLLARRRPAARRGGYSTAPFIGAGDAHHSTSGGGFDGGGVSGGFDGGGCGGGGDGGGGGC
ncbi:hypothetical protein OOZ19_12685 [Saccharopolyspora sp. NFXS83]|uniref:hypothetical protein n=1 Tax=Saccharopolyspora sp. NFXS83 TaxID=2993560 RepID=UPI00224B226D|nr:hypothetical protein [Saccharopolyspora sp. NFXS83]MCX2731100.1 hypothetical protein [Saccharopolyspora sp. NFXS83]